MPDNSHLTLVVDGVRHTVEDDGSSLLEVLRDRIGARSAKDGCSPQGQCGCCTVLVDGAPRVACVTPARRVEGRAITTVDGLEDATTWAGCFSDSGASQCGFCTPGIVVRLSALAAAGRGPDDLDAVERALLAHLCRCTGWRTILDAWQLKTRFENEIGPPRAPSAHRTAANRERRAELEGGTAQQVSAEVALGRGGFADDTAPPDALVAVPDGAGGWVVAPTLAEARRLAGKVQGRRTTAALRHPLEVPEGDWARTLRTTWVEPAYLEPDASWCAPGGQPASPLANGGAFGGKVHSVVGAAARRLADEHGRPVRVLLSREDVVRLGPKRPPIAAGVRADGTGAVRVVRLMGIADAIRRYAPGLEVEEVDVAGPPVSCDPRAAGWAEAAVLLQPERVVAPNGSWAEAGLDDDGVRVTVSCGDPLDDVVLRSYCVGAAHMALGWVASEGLAVDEAGEVQDLTIRSFGVLRAVDTPPIHVTIEPSSEGEPRNGSDAVFAAVAAAAWRAQGFPPEWPTGGRYR